MLYSLNLLNDLSLGQLDLLLSDARVRLDQLLHHLFLFEVLVDLGESLLALAGCLLSIQLLDLEDLVVRALWDGELERCLTVTDIPIPISHIELGEVFLFDLLIGQDCVKLFLNFRCLVFAEHLLERERLCLTRELDFAGLGLVAT